MTDLSFLDDEQAREAVVRMVEEAARRYKPQELPRARAIAEGYLDQVADAGELLYARPASSKGFGFNGPETFWLLLVLPAVAGCLGNLLAEAGVKMFAALRDRLFERGDVEVRIRAALEKPAQAAGLTEADVNRLTVAVGAVLIAMLSENQAGSHA